MLTAVDLFAGAGGSSTGARWANVKVVWAANHCPIAVKCHSRNHPETKHACQDLRQADWRNTPDHNICLASPECRGHTKARGKHRPHHDSSRATAWAVVDCVEVKQPDYLIVENVPDMRGWRHYQRWLDCLREDYHVSENVLDAADCGVPQNRERLFVVGVHKRISKVGLKIKQRSQPHKPASQIIDWDNTDWSRIYRKGRSPNTIAKIEEAKEEFGKKPFLIAYYGNSRGGRSLGRPIGTLTTKDRYAIVEGQWMRMLSVGECKVAMGFPKNYWLPDCHKQAIKLLGNAVCPPCMQHVVNQVRNFNAKKAA